MRTFNILCVVSTLCAGVGIKLRLLTDLIESTFDFSSVASAMKEDVWQTYVHRIVGSQIATSVCLMHYARINLDHLRSHVILCILHVYSEVQSMHMYINMLGQLAFHDLACVLRNLCAYDLPCGFTVVLRS